MPGPPPEPTALKKWKGNPGKRALPADEPQYRTAPAKPRGMPKKAQQLWDNLAPLLEDVGILTGPDGPAFQLLAEQWWIIDEARKSLQKHGLIIVDINDQPRKNPAYQIYRDAVNLYTKLSKEFGLTPSSRTRVAAPEPPELDELEEFFNND